MKVARIHPHPLLFGQTIQPIRLAYESLRPAADEIVRVHQPGIPPCPQLRRPVLHRPNINSRRNGGRGADHGLRSRCRRGRPWRSAVGLIADIVKAVPPNVLRLPGGPRRRLPPQCCLCRRAVEVRRAICRIRRNASQNWCDIRQNTLIFGRIWIKFLQFGTSSWIAPRLELVGLEDHRSRILPGLFHPVLNNRSHGALALGRFACRFAVHRPHDLISRWINAIRKVRRSEWTHSSNWRRGRDILPSHHGGHTRQRRLRRLRYSAHVFLASGVLLLPNRAHFLIGLVSRIRPKQRLRHARYRLQWMLDRRGVRASLLQLLRHATAPKLDRKLWILEIESRDTVTHCRSPVRSTCVSVPLATRPGYRRSAA